LHKVSKWGEKSTLPPVQMLAVVLPTFTLTREQWMATMGQKQTNTFTNECGPKGNARRRQM